MDAQEELTELRARVAQLESMVERLSSGSGGSPRSAPREAARTEPVAVGRRRILRNGLGLSAAAVAGVGLVDAMGSPAAADTGDPVLVGQNVGSSPWNAPPTRISNADVAGTSALLFLVDNSLPEITIPAVPDTLAVALAGRSFGANPSGTTQVGVYGTTNYGVGVWGESGGEENGAGVRGHNRGEGPGVKGTSDRDTGVWGDTATTEGAGVLGTNTVGWGVAGLSESGVGVVASSSSGVGLAADSVTGVALKADASSAVGVQATSTAAAAVSATSTHGPGVTAVSTSGPGLAGSSTTAPGVTGTSDTAAGVTGVSTTAAGLAGTSDSGPGVRAVSRTGLGASLQGGSAAVRLVPQTKAGHPTKGRHLRGELLVDAQGKPWLCTKAGTPGTWRQIAFV